VSQAEFKYVREYLRQSVEMMKQSPCKGLSDIYYNLQDFVLQEGFDFEPSPYPEAYPPGVIKECFSNSISLVEHHPDELIYCEGYAAGVIPVLHAWCVTHDGKVVDPTWNAHSRCSPGTEYLGVPLNREFVMETLAAKGTHGILDNWMMHWPILGHPRKEWLHEIFLERVCQQSS